MWTYVMTKPDGNVIACSEWGTNYDFDARYWDMLPVID